MPRIKSLIIRVEIDEVQKAHNCQGNAAHHLVRGEKRLKVRKGRSWDHYCVSCATAILERDIAELQTLQRRFELSKLSRPKPDVLRDERLAPTKEPNRGTLHERISINRDAL